MFQKEEILIDSDKMSESDNGSECVPDIDDDSLDIESGDLVSNDSDSDSNLYNLDDSNEEDEVDQCWMWYEINMQNISPPPPRFPFTDKPSVAGDIAASATPLDFFEFFSIMQRLS